MQTADNERDLRVSRTFVIDAYQVLYLRKLATEKKRSMSEVMRELLDKVIGQDGVG